MKWSTINVHDQSSGKIWTDHRTNCGTYRLEQGHGPGSDWALMVRDCGAFKHYSDHARLSDGKAEAERLESRS
jgi:hypothetical protein